jgi:hypothetical protein
MPVPTNTVLPTITGTPTVGSTLSLTHGTWTGGVTSYTHQWQRINDSIEDIAGATGETYTPQAFDTAHMIQVVVTATNNSGSASATSLPTITVLGSWFVPEDGTGLSTATAYCSLEDANLYHATRGNTSWVNLSRTARESALTLATDYMIQVFRARWKGYRKNGTQTLDWPRTFVYLEPFVHGIVGTYPYLVSDIIVPLEVKNACAVLALKTISAELLSDISQGILSKTVGPISITYDRGTSQVKQYLAIEGMLAPYLNGTSLSSEAQRG